MPSVTARLTRPDPELPGCTAQPAWRLYAYVYAYVRRRHSRRQSQTQLQNPAAELDFATAHFRRNAANVRRAACALLFSDADSRQGRRAGARGSVGINLRMLLY